jgi:hypothetical protein
MTRSDVSSDELRHGVKFPRLTGSPSKSYDTKLVKNTSRTLTTFSMKGEKIIIE